MKWRKSPLVWRDGSTEYISVVFTWDLPKVKALIRQKKIGIERRFVGGPAVKIMPDYFSGDPVEVLDYYPGVLQKYNPLATSEEYRHHKKPVNAQQKDLQLDC